jgi:hypothetical protein
MKKAEAGMLSLVVLMMLSTHLQTLHADCNADCKTNSSKFDCRSKCRQKELDKQPDEIHKDFESDKTAMHKNFEENSNSMFKLAGFAMILIIVLPIICICCIGGCIAYCISNQQRNAPGRGGWNRGGFVGVQNQYPPVMPGGFAGFNNPNYYNQPQPAAPPTTFSGATGASAGPSNHGLPGSSPTFPTENNKNGIYATGTSDA